MPATFESFGLQFLYPENWTRLARGDDEGADGATLELPTGGFFSIELDREGMLDEELVEEVVDSIAAEYEEVERETVQLAGALPDEMAVDFRFYYLDLLIISRLILLTLNGRRYVIQIQAESRDFDSNEMVFAAILKQLRESNP